MTRFILGIEIPLCFTYTLGRKTGVFFEGVMKMKTLFSTMIVTALLAASLLSEGCATKSMNTVQNAQTEGIPMMVMDQRILTDPSLSRSVYIVGVNEAYTEDGYRKVQVQLYNRTRRMKAFTYRVEWYDKDGMLIGSPLDHRTPTQIEGGQRKSIPILATSPKAVDFRFTFMESLAK